MKKKEENEGVKERRSERGKEEGLAGRLLKEDEKERRHDMRKLTD